MRLLFMGSPGTGKGTYAQTLKEVLGIPHISSGDLLRDEIARGTPLGKELEELLAGGNFASDDVVLGLIEKRIKEPDCERGFILDGFPRNIDQAKQMEDLVEVSHVLNFKADDEVIIERLGGRITCKECSKIFHKKGYIPKREGKCDDCEGELIERDDDKPEAIQQRLELYREKTAPLMEHFDKKGLLIEVVINKPISEIRDQLILKVKSFLEGKTDTIGEIR